jgi:hypothetical protein
MRGSTEGARHHILLDTLGPHSGRQHIDRHGPIWAAGDPARNSQA